MTDHIKNRISAAKITTAHGVRGFVKLFVMLDDPSLLENVPVYTEDGQPVRLTLKNPAGKFWVAEIDGVADRNAAEALRNTELFVDRSVLPDAEEGEYYAADLIGLKAVDETGKEIGTVIAVEDFGASPLLDIKPARGPSFYLPFTKDNVPEERMADGVIVVRLPEGLL